eukprot:gnl/MRDRNA2_/MRDRNA2_293988_c0_seq1.p1 gnl/MRDRNA2_/MRDRNA2_293988_c0~~gnl/MRDRNA2_/MRDRNA2_293988_c0_seq1.p1  ORF type:complete len:373 (-),score=40.15 gnl/MRDRNA2_/MRDRNA2_293988_c0_seq1:115-1116(-)
MGDDSVPMSLQEEHPGQGPAAISTPSSASSNKMSRFGFMLHAEDSVQLNISQHEDFSNALPHAMESVANPLEVDSGLDSQRFHHGLSFRRVKCPQMKNESQNFHDKAPSFDGDYDAESNHARLFDQALTVTHFIPSPRLERASGGRCTRWRAWCASGDLHISSSSSSSHNNISPSSSYLTSRILEQHTRESDDHAHQGKLSAGRWLVEFRGHARQIPQGLEIALGYINKRMQRISIAQEVAKFLGASIGSENGSLATITSSDIPDGEYVVADYMVTGKYGAPLSRKPLTTYRQSFQGRRDVVVRTPASTPPRSESSDEPFEESFRPFEGPFER